jgi:hypothetical protein
VVGECLVDLDAHAGGVLAGRPHVGEQPLPVERYAVVVQDEVRRVIAVEDRSRILIAERDLLRVVDQVCAEIVSGKDARAAGHAAASCSVVGGCLPRLISDRRVQVSAAA